MTMMQKMQAKKSKKGFTLVELVIVIAILAILAAIAIPVITTTINSSKKSTMQSDLTTIDMCLKEAVNTSLAEIDETYNSKKVGEATVADVLAENGLAETLLDGRAIGGKQYIIGWDGQAAHIYDIKASGQKGATFLNTKVADLTPAGAAGSKVDYQGSLAEIDPTSKTE